MLTIFTTAKPFSGHIDIIQQNAIRSWLSLRPECEIILFDGEKGTAEIADELGIRRVPEVQCNEYGTPLISDIFKVAQQLASYPLMCYVNADIILMEDFLEAVAAVAHRRNRFLLVGQRWNLDIKEPIVFGPDWQGGLKSRLPQTGELEPPDGIDFLVFRRGMWGKILPFVVGRPCWDNWLIYRARRLGIPVVDTTRVVSVIHQNHDYSHVPNGTGKGWEGPEADYNRQLLESWDHIFTILDATHLLTSRGLFPALGFTHLRRRCETLPILFPVMRPVIRPIGMLRRHLGRTIGSSSQ